MSIQSQAQTFARVVDLNFIIENAEHQAKLLKELEPKPWRRSEEQKDAIDTFEQFGRYARRILQMNAIEKEASSC